jgi:hypothetical protein
VCDGACPTGQGCADVGGACACAPGTCGLTFPACDGTCGPDEACASAGGACQCNSLLLDLDGDYQLDLQVLDDRCGLGPPAGPAPAQVQEQGTTAAIVDIPQGGAGGPCHPLTFARTGNTLSASSASTTLSGSCQLHVASQTSLSFAADGSVTGQETDVLSAGSGDCSALVLPCTVTLQATGARCTGCFSCVVPETLRPRPSIGLFGGASAERLPDR